MDNKNKIIDAFKNVKANGWVSSHRSHNTGIGKTLEDLMKIKENNIQEPDLYGYEIKSHRSTSKSRVSLFTLAPSSDAGNANLRDLFGKDKGSGKKTLFTSIFGNRFNSYDKRLSFKLIVNREEQRVYIGVYKLRGAECLNSSVYYTFDDINNVLSLKLNKLFYAPANCRVVNKVEEFQFNSAVIYTDTSIEKFIYCIENGFIMYDLRMGVYKSGEHEGEPHDHGSGFRIKPTDFGQLYDKCEKIN